MDCRKKRFQRTALLFGHEKMERMAQIRVILFGIGGVGSWCAESLIRSGIEKLTIVDSDRICTSNINRQLHATSLSVGQVKTEALKSRLLEINPDAEIRAIQKIYNQENYECFELGTYDYIIDAIDSLSSKIDLIRRATRTQARFFSSMGASLKIDPAQIRVAEFWKVRGCPLGSALRKRIRKGDLPAKEFMCVYSEELLENRASDSESDCENDDEMPSGLSLGDPELANHQWSQSKAVINGTVAHITAIFGFTLAGLVLQDIYQQQ